MKSRIMIIDDDPAIARMLRSTLGGDEFEFLDETDSERAFARIMEDRPHVALIDITMPKKSGMQILQEVKKADPGLSVIMATGHQNTRYAIEAMKYGAYDYVTKPFELKKLKELFHRAAESTMLNRKVRFSRTPGLANDDTLDGGDDLMIGSSPEMLEIWKMVGKVADSDATVLIQGESGTGKELLARAIYSNSRRSNRPFLAVNCAALPENLLESELFGHEKGAFTDAHARRIGKFEQCNGGTIFLDEIGEMSLANQGKLLRVLESQEFERVGGNETIRVDVRVIAATNRSLVQLVKEKAFRLDLFYRLRVVNFFLPPLRERQEDIPLLVEFFVRRFNRRYGKTIRGVTPEAMELLKNQVWEGNIRELKNVINSAMVFCKGEVLSTEDFSQFIQLDKRRDVTGGEDVDDYYTVFSRILEPMFDSICSRNKGSVYENVNMGLERALIRMTMEKVNNNQVMAAKMLGISRNTLRDRLERYRLATDDRAEQ